MDVYKVILDPNRATIRECMDVIEEFIAERNLVIYGGLSIDSALRKSDPELHIYERLKLEYADYDFQTPNFLRDIVDLAERIVTRTSAARVEVANAVHITSMRLSVDGQVIADIGYVPRSIRAKMPTFTFITIRGNNATFTAPILQIMDMHNVFALPYANPPREVFSHRAEKDIKRFNLLWDACIVPQIEMFEGEKIRTVEMKFTLPMGAMLTGLSAYAWIVTRAAARGFKSANRVSFTCNKERQISTTIEGRGDIDSEIPEYFSSEKLVATHEPFLELFPRSRRTQEAIIYINHYHWYAVVQENSLCVGTVHVIARNLLTHAVYFGSQFHLRCYYDMMRALEHYAEDDPAFLLGNTYWPHGAKNLSDAKQYYIIVAHMNLKDRLALGNPSPNFADMENTRKAAQMRPPMLIVPQEMDKKYEEARERFLSWDLASSPYFAISGESWSKETP